MPSTTHSVSITTSNFCVKVIGTDIEDLSGDIARYSKVVIKSVKVRGVLLPSTRTILVIGCWPQNLSGDEDFDSAFGLSYGHFAVSNQDGPTNIKFDIDLTGLITDLHDYGRYAKPMAFYAYHNREISGNATLANIVFDIEYDVSGVGRNVALA
jgi:hypothetical protein